MQHMKDLLLVLFYSLSLLGNARAASGWDPDLSVDNNLLDRANWQGQATLQSQAALWVTQANVDWSAMTAADVQGHYNYIRDTPFFAQPLQLGSKTVMYSRRIPWLDLQTPSVLKTYSEDTIESRTPVPGAEVLNLKPPAEQDADDDNNGATHTTCSSPPWSSSRQQESIPLSAPALPPQYFPSPPSEIGHLMPDVDQEDLVRGVKSVVRFK
ncbi:hypothetical protein HDU90_004216, partial [Geranomyces variabilis]